MRWLDETDCTLQIAGTDIQGMKLSGRFLSPSYLNKFIEIQPGSSVATTVQCVAARKAHYGPLYFVFARWWAELTGTGVVAMRSFTAAVSVLCLPAAYWLALELFELPAVALTFVALVTVAPLHVEYAQEINRYSMWTLAILVSSAALLRALKAPSRRNWIVYTLAIAASLYTNLASGLVLLSDITYVAFTNWKGQKTQKIKFALSVLACALLITPWIVVIVINLKEVMAINSSLMETYTPAKLCALQLENATLTFFDYWKKLGMSSPVAGGMALVVEFFCVGYVCWSKQWREKGLFCLSLIAGTLLPIFLSDLLLGGCKNLIPAIHISLANRHRTRRSLHFGNQFYGSICT